MDPWIADALHPHMFPSASGVTLVSALSGHAGSRVGIVEGRVSAVGDLLSEWRVTTQW